MQFGKNLTVRMGALGMLVAVVFAFAPSSAGAQLARAVGVTPPRLSFIDGEVSYWRPGADDWAPAQINTALAAGDSLYAADGGNVEVEIGTRAYVRAGSGTELGVESLETGYLQLRVPSGHAVVDLRRLAAGQEIEVGTPNGAFLIEHTGYYRFDVDDQSTRFSSRKGGVARVVPAGGAELEVGPSQEVVVTGTDNASLERVSASADDVWDRWNYDRTGQLGEQPRSAQYVSPDVAGVDDLDRYGDWRETPKYGNVWVPRDVGSDWTPYSDGRWVWDGYYGWTWVDYSPWGWAPYHYGRWCWNDGYWGWAPGAVVRPVYAPALVAFFGGGGVGVSVSVGTPFVSWVPLGWGEPVVPWWGPRGFVGRPYWGGWGGPRYVNNVQVNNTTIINVNNINRYDNFRNGRAVVGVSGDRFGRGGRGEHIRVDADRMRNLRPIRGEVGVRPVRESLVARSGRGAPPPDRIQNRRVVATRAPQDPARAPRSAGLVQPNSRRQPEPRIVTPTRERSQGRELTRDRNMPPLRGVDRSRMESPEMRGRTGRPEEAGRGPGNERGVERIPGGDNGNRGEAMRRGLQPPDANTGQPRERDRNGRDVEPQIRGNREPTPPSLRGKSQQERGRDGGDRIRVPGGNEPGGRDANVPPPSNRGGNDAREHGRSRIDQPEPARIDRGQERTREAAPPRSFDAGSERARGRDQHIEQPQRMEQPRERAPEPRMEAPRQREVAPRQERQEPTHVDRQPRAERQAPQVDRQPHVERQEAPRAERPARMERQEAPRMERQAAPEVHSGGGEPRGGGGSPRGGGEPRGGGAPSDGGNRGHHKDRD